MRDIRVVSLGLGPIGRRIAARVSADERFTLVGAADIDPAVHGRTLREVLGSDGAADIEVVPAAEDLPRGPGVALLTTSSRLRTVAGQVKALVDAGWNVLSTAEELAYPWVSDQALAEHLDQAATAAGVSVLGAGINPGFLLDTLVLSLRYACVRVDRISVVRRVDTDQRRGSLQEKAGVGLTKDEFAAGVEQGRIGHAGLIQSAHLLAAGLGWTVDDYRETIEPVIAETARDTGLGRVEAGLALGQRQHAAATVGGRERIVYDLAMYAGCEPTDEITIEGEPRIHQVIEGGVNGDAGTEAVVVNLIGQLPDAPAGLLTMARIASLR